MDLMRSLLIAVLLIGFLPTEGWAQMTEVKMGVAFVNARVAPLWVAEKEGYFRTWRTPVSSKSSTRAGSSTASTNSEWRYWPERSAAELKRGGQS